MVNILDNVLKNDPAHQQHGDSDTANKITNQELKCQNSCSACLTEGWHQDLWLQPKNFLPRS